MSKKGKEIIREVDNFIKRLRTQDLVISQEAETIRYKEGRGRGSKIIELHPTNLSEGLSCAISQYEINKDAYKRKMFADYCLLWINRAFSHGVVQEGEGLISKNKELEDENDLLRERLNKYE